MSKKQLGQFYTTNADIILKDFQIPEQIIEPFVGNGDLIQWAIKHGLKKYIAYDINPPKTLKYKCAVRNTLKNPPVYKNKFVILSLKLFLQ